LNVMNLLKVPVWPRDGGKSSIIKAGGEISYDKKVSPYDVTTYRFSYDSIYKKTFFVEVSISIGALPKFPFYKPGEVTYIQVKVTNALTGATTTYKTSPKVRPAQGSVSTLTATGLNSPNLNITLSIDAKWGQNTAQVVFEDYYGSPLAGKNNEGRIFYNILRPFQSIRQLSTPIWNNVLAISKTRMQAHQGWRFIRVRDNEYRILNMKTTQAISLNPFGHYFTMETPSLDSLNQVWTVIPAWDQQVSSKLYYVQGAGNVCWSLDLSETELPTPSNVGHPLRLLPCNTGNTSQHILIETVKFGSDHLEWVWS